MSDTKETQGQEPSAPQQAPQGASGSTLRVGDLPPKILDAISTMPVHLTPQGISVAGALWNVSIVLIGTRLLPNYQSLDIPEAVVMLSWEQAKTLSMALERLIKNYEDSQCVVNLPKSFVDMVEKQDEKQRQ